MVVPSGRPAVIKAGRRSADQQGDHALAFVLGDLPRKNRRERTPAVVGALVDFVQQLAHLRRCGLVIRVGIGIIILALVTRRVELLEQLRARIKITRQESVL